MSLPGQLRQLGDQLRLAGHGAFAGLYVGEPTGALTRYNVSTPAGTWVPTTFRLGWSVWGNEHFIGDIGGSKLWGARLSDAEIEAELAAQLGFTRVLWLGDGLINDHTDGHVDNLARFVAPNRLVVPQATGEDDPNAAIYADAAARAADFGVEVVRIPSPGRIERGGRVEPASYVNFAITSHLVVVPTFGSPHDAEGVAAIAALFPDRDTIGLPGGAVLAGGGGFHCASQQMPSLPAG